MEVKSFIYFVILYIFISRYILNCHNQYYNMLKLNNFVLILELYLSIFWNDNCIIELNERRR